MKKSTIVIILLFISLISTNCYWIFHSIDNSVSLTYQEVSLNDNQTALKQILNVVPLMLNNNILKADIIPAAEVGINDSLAFDKDGFFFIGRIGLKFDKNDRLVEIIRAWSD